MPILIEVDLCKDVRISLHIPLQKKASIRMYHVCGNIQSASGAQVEDVKSMNSIIGTLYLTIFLV